MSVNYTSFIGYGIELEGYELKDAIVKYSKQHKEEIMKDYGRIIATYDDDDKYIDWVEDEGWDMIAIDKFEDYIHRLDCYCYGVDSTFLFGKRFESVSGAYLSAFNPSDMAEFEKRVYNDIQEKFKELFPENKYEPEWHIGMVVW